MYDANHNELNVNDMVMKVIVCRFEESFEQRPAWGEVVREGEMVFLLYCYAVDGKSTKVILLLSIEIKGDFL